MYSGNRFIEGIEEVDLIDRMEDRIDNFKDSIERTADADGAILKAINGVNVGIQGLRVATGAVTTPIIFALNNIGKIMPFVGRVILQPIQIPAFLFTRLFSTRSKYNGKMIGEVGEELGTIIGGLSQVTSLGVSLL